MTASFIITIFFGIFLFKEQIGAKQIIGILFIIAAVIMLIKYNNELKTKLTLKKLMVLLVCKIICMLKKTPHRRQGRMTISGKDIMYIFIMSAMLYVNSFCLTYATEYIPSVVLYPLNGVLQFAGMTVMSTLLLKEKMTRASAYGLVCVFIAILLTK